MKIGLTIGFAGNECEVLALPDKHIREQRAMFKQAILDGGVVGGKHFDKLVSFEEPLKIKKFKPVEVKAKKGKKAE